MAVPRRMNGVREEAVPRRMNGVHDLTDDSRAFWNGAELGDVDQLRHALDNLDGSIDVPLEGGYTALHLTCMLGFLPCVQVPAVLAWPETEVRRFLDEAAAAAASASNSH